MALAESQLSLDYYRAQVKFNKDVIKRLEKEPEIKYRDNDIG